MYSLLLVATSFSWPWSKPEPPAGLAAHMEAAVRNALEKAYLMGFKDGILVTLVVVLLIYFLFLRKD